MQYAFLCNCADEAGEGGRKLGEIFVDRKFIFSFIAIFRMCWIEHNCIFLSSFALFLRFISTFYIFFSVLVFGCERRTVRRKGCTRELEI